MSLLRRLTSRLKRAKSEDELSLSVVLICHKMEQQVGNTLRTLLTPYQKKIKSKDYEILLIDNGSPGPLPEGTWKLKKIISHTYIPPDKALPSPAVAINRAAARSRGKVISIMIDGARMLSPGVLFWGLRLLELAPRGVVEVRGWHLGPKYQPESIMEGYNHEVETQLLNECRWWENGYRLFNIASATPQTREGYFSATMESNCIFLSRELFNEIGGYDERYTEPGGGWVNLDFFSRATAAASRVFTLLGEGTFHQVHGGAATGLAQTALEDANVRWREESKNLRGDFPAPDRSKFILAGHMPPECKEWLLKHIK